MHSIMGIVRGLSLAEEALEEAIQRIARSRSEDEALKALSDALGRVYSLEEYHSKRLAGPPYYRERDQRPDGRVVGALVYARGFDVHELVTHADLADVYTDSYTSMYGTLRWRSQLPPPRPKHPP